MKRLFVFGCSFTAYSWPTYADFLGLEYDHYENWAMAGLGNRAIMERMAECHARNNFTKDDTVIVQWTTHLRNDFFNRFGPEDRPSGWKTAGSIFNYLNRDIYDQKWIDTFFFEPAFVMHSFNYILMGLRFLESTGCTWYTTSVGDPRNIGADLIDGNGYAETLLVTDEEKNSKEGFLAWKKYPEMKVYQKAIWDDYADKWLPPIFTDAKATMNQFYEFQDPDDGTFFHDMHPVPRQHASWLETHLIPRLNLANPNCDQYYEIVNSIDKIYEHNYRNKKGFEIMIRNKETFTKLEKFVWPNYYRGFA